MQVTVAWLVLMIWVAVSGAAVIVAGVLIWKRGVNGVGWALGTVLGGLMMFGVVSAVIGLYEMTAYYLNPIFFVSLAIGAAGLCLFGMGCRQLRHRNS